MKAEQWLAARRPAPPEPLHDRLRGLLAGGGDDASADVSARLLERGAATLAGVLAGAASSRDSARELLAADALVTYAFEAAADTPEGLEERARGALASLAALGAEGAS